MEKIYYKYFQMSEKLFIFYIMKKNRLASYKKLMADRAIDMSKIFGDAPPTAIAIERIKHLKGVKRFFYLFMLIIEGNATNKEKYRAEFEMAMIHWQHDRVSSTHLEKRADQIINEELKITDAIETVEPTDVGDYIDFETVEK